VEKSEERKKEKPKKKAAPIRRPQRIQHISTPEKYKGHISEVEISNSSDA